MFENEDIPTGMEGEPTSEEVLAKLDQQVAFLSCKLRVLESASAQKSYRARLGIGEFASRPMPDDPDPFNWPVSLAEPLQKRAKHAGRSEAIQQFFAEYPSLRAFYNDGKIALIFSVVSCTSSALTLSCGCTRAAGPIEPTYRPPEPYL